MLRLLRNFKKYIPSYLFTQKLRNTARDAVLITFDDGPKTEVTGEVLQRLRKFDAKALFFVVGERVSNAPHVIDMIKKEGHLLGNHTCIHANETQPSFLSYLRDILKCQKKIRDITGENMKFFRPPHGTISFTTVFGPKFLGLRTVLWSVEVGDWRCRTKEEATKVSEKIIKDIRPLDILVLHDDNPFVLDILDQILPHLSKYDLGSGINHL